MVMALAPVPTTATVLPVFGTRPQHGTLPDQASKLGPERRENHLEAYKNFLPESHGHDLALTVLCVPYSLDLTVLCVPYSLDSGGS